MRAKLNVEIYSSGSDKCHRTYDLINTVLSQTYHEYCVIRIHDMTIPEVQIQAMKLGVKRAPAVVINGKLLKDSIGKIPKKDKLKKLLSSKQPA